MSEDQEWSRRMLLAGHTIVYEPSAAVRHSHAYTLRAAFRRFYASGASADRSYVAGDESRAALRRAFRRYAAGELRWLWRTGRRRRLSQRYLLTRRDRRRCGLLPRSRTLLRGSDIAFRYERPVLVAAFAGPEWSAGGATLR